MYKLINSVQLDLLKRHVGPFLFCFLTMMFLLLMQFLILHIEDLIGKDIPVPVIIELILTNLAYMVVLASPMAVLVATLMAFGKFSELNELTAVRASGVNPVKVIAPVFVASMLLCAGLIWFSNEVLPEANHKSRSLFIDIRVKKPGFDLKPNSFYSGLDGYTFLVKEIDNATDSLYDVLLFQEPSSSRDRAYIKAEKGKLVSEGDQALSLYLFNGTMQSFPPSRTGGFMTIEKSRFDQHRITFDLADLAFERSDPNRRNRSDRTMNIQAMQATIDSLKQDIAEQYQKVSDSNFTLPKASHQELSPLQGVVSEYQLNPEDTVNLDPAFITPYLVINSLAPDKRKLLINRTISDLKNYKASFESVENNVLFRVKSIKKYLVEIHKKFSIPFACMVFVLFGAPIGIMTRKGNFGIAAIISAVILTFYWISLIQGEKLADRLYISPFVGMWTFNIVLSIAGILLILRLSTELSLKRILRRNA